MECAHLQSHKVNVSVQRQLDLGELVHGKARLLIKSKHLRREEPRQAEPRPLILGEGSVLGLACIIKDRSWRLYLALTIGSARLCSIHGQADCSLDIRWPGSSRQPSFIGSLLNNNIVGIE